MKTRGWREARLRAMKSLRAAVGLSQLAVAGALEISERRYWRIENGYDEPTDVEKRHLAKLLKTSVSALPFEQPETTEAMS